jgi:hypothetical protein
MSYEKNDDDGQRSAIGKRAARRKSESIRAIRIIIPDSDLPSINYNYVDCTSHEIHPVGVHTRAACILCTTARMASHSICGPQYCNACAREEQRRRERRKENSLPLTHSFLERIRSEDTKAVAPNAERKAKIENAEKRI